MTANLRLPHATLSQKLLELLLCKCFFYSWHLVPSNPTPFLGGLMKKKKKKNIVLRYLNLLAIYNKPHVADLLFKCK